MKETSIPANNVAIKPLKRDILKSSLWNECGGVGDAVRDGGAINSSYITQQRSVGGKFCTLTDAVAAAADLGVKTGSGGTADSTTVQQ